MLLWEFMGDAALIQILLLEFLGDAALGPSGKTPAGSDVRVSL
jgi:hypothetical protein